MTRKRFKKLLMSYGYSRNEAEHIALCARSFYESYGAANHAYLNYYEINKMVFDFTNAVFAIGKAFVSLKDEFANIINSMQSRKDDVNE